ncbi:MAG: hypothetical protein C0623_00885 [Desulfuromonas sp.]|nr:MAG: hypothetical protein C0623_00885 [Desulfuromonas sp.]
MSFLMVKCRLVTAIALTAILVLSGCAGTSGPSAPLPESPSVRPDSDTVSRLKEGRIGFFIADKGQYNVNQRDLFVLGVDALNTGAYDVAVDCFKAIVKAAPTQTAPYLNLAIAYIRSGQDDRAVAPLKKVLDKVAGHPLASHEYGLLMRRAGRFNEARDVYEKSLELYPEYYPLHKNLGILCDIYLNDLECASSQYELFLEAQPEDELVRLWLAEVRGRMRR